MNFIEHLRNYTKERYKFSDIDSISDAYIKYLEANKYIIHSVSCGFITYKIQGDACICLDIYTTSEARKTKKAWELFSFLKKEARKNNCNVIIGFSEIDNMNPEDGIGAMLSAGFIKAYTLNDKFVFIRGTH